MPTVVATLTFALLLCTLATASADALFEDALAVPVEKRPHGPRGMPGDIIELKDGTLLMSYTQEAGLMGIKSSDAGKTWGEPFVLVPKPQPPAGGRLAHPGFLRLKSGDLMLSYIHSTHPATPYYANTYYRKSADEGATWTDQYILTPHSGYVLVHNDRLQLLSTGRILAMAEYKAHFPTDRDHSGYAGMSFYSDDDGLSWHPSKNLVDMQPVEVQEADAVELKDGRIMMFARTYSGYPVRAYSSDGGETWSKGEKIEGMEMPYAGLPTVRRLPSTGDLVFLWISEKSVDKENPKIHRRCCLSSCLSKDEGQTFEHQRALARDPEDDFGYQSLDFLGDDTAIVSYHARDGLHVARIGLDWFYGK